MLLGDVCHFREQVLSITFMVLLFGRLPFDVALGSPQENNRPRAEWIAPYEGTSTSNVSPSPLLRSTFHIEGHPASGSVRLVGLGHYELYLNGNRVGTSVIHQAWSQYDRTLYSEEFDISAFLRKGDNAWGALLGNSFWHVGPANDAMRFIKTDAMPDFSNGYPYLLFLEAHIRTEEGNEIVVTSSESWKWSMGPLTFSNIYAGEDFDARMLPVGWASPGFNDRMWEHVIVAPVPKGSVEEYSAPLLREFQVFDPDSIVSPKADEYTFIYPQNCSALLRFTVQGSAGQTIRFRPCEYMDSTGQVKFTYTWGTGKDIWFDYTLKGGSSESHQALFCYEGCQYVGVTGAVPEGYPNPRGLPIIKQLQLVHVRAANEVVGQFTCSSALQNGAHRLIDWSIRSNMSYVATDCPHREKNGWQEQNWHMARAMSYRFDIHSWYKKIARDLTDAQLPDGHIPTNCPNYLVGIPPHGFWNEAPEWGISGVLVPWHLFEWYGDTNAIVTSFESMRRYVDYLSSQAKDGIITSNLGDWYDYGHGKGDGPSQWTPNEVSATAIWALGAATVSRSAQVLGRTVEAESYQSLFNQIRKDFQRHFYDPASKTVLNHGSCQAANSAALCIGLVPDADRKEVLQAIVDDLAKRNWQQTAGEVLQVFFLRALAEGNRNDILYRVYSREDRGSYGYMVREGLTTLPESWDARRGTGGSMNHFMLGHLMEWHYAYVAGIRQQPGSVGWRRVLIAPNPGSLDNASASFNSPAGRIEVHWEHQANQFVMVVSLPAGVQGEAVLPSGKRQSLGPGTVTLREDSLGEVHGAAEGQ